MPTRKLFPISCAALLAAFATLPALADWQPDAVVLQAGGGDAATKGSVGLAWDWDWQLRRRGLFTAHTELLLSHWRADRAGGGHASYRQVTLLPLLRIRPDAGHAPWFMEFGIGASWLDREFVTAEKTFSTRWNFYDVIGGGYSFGAQRRHELGLRYVHVSNAGIRKPNPGADFLLLRYAYRF
jgi:hypothetical protein